MHSVMYRLFPITLVADMRSFRQPLQTGKKKKKKHGKVHVASKVKRPNKNVANRTRV